MSKSRNLWTPTDLSILRCRYPSEGPAPLALMLNRPKNSITEKAFREGLKYEGG